MHQVGHVLYTPGILPYWGDEIRHTGGADDPSLLASLSAARLCVENIAALVKEELGSLDRVTQLCRLNIMVRGPEDSRTLARVADGASAAALEIFGKKGRHMREVVATPDLPGGAAVQVSAVIRFH